MKPVCYVKMVMAIPIALLILAISSFGFCESISQSGPSQPLKLVPKHDSSNSFFMSYKYKERAETYATGDISLFNTTGAWFEVTREDTVNTQAIPHAFLMGHKGDYPLNEKVFKDVRIGEGQYLQLNATRTTTAAYLALALDLIGRGLFGVTMPENILDGTHPLITELFATIKSNHSGELGAFGYAITTKDYDGAIKHLAKFITSTKKSKEVMLKLIREVFGPENSVRYASFMSKNLADIVFAFRPVKLLTEITYWTFKAPTEGYARLEAIGQMPIQTGAALKNIVDYLVNILKNEADLDKQNRAIQRFKWDYGSDKTYEALKEILYQREDADIVVKRSAILCLGYLKDKRALDIFIDFLNHQDSTIKVNCLYSLWRLGVDSRAVEPVMKLLGEPDPDVRGNAAYLLGNIGDKRAVEPLIALLKDNEPNVRANAATALGYIGDERARKHLIRISKDENENMGVRGVAESALINMEVPPSQRHVFRKPPP